MANASSKKIAAANQRTLHNLWIGLVVVNIIYLAWAGALHWASWTKTQMLLYASTSGLTLYFYKILTSSGTPKYNADGSLRSSGDDLNAEGLTAYMFDIIYVTWFVHITTAFISTKFWFVYLVIPAYALYKIVPMAMSFLGNMSGAGDANDGAETTGKSKRQQKVEQRGGKGKVKHVRG